jgi:hypothetical protein
MKQILTGNENTINFSLGSFMEVNSFKKMFEGIKQSLQKEQKDLVLGRKNRQETDKYFNFMKFLFSSPDKAI